MATTQKGQTALITGASSGIGYELARCFAQAGYNLVVVSRELSDIERVAREFGSIYQVEVTPLAKDFFQPGAAEELYTEIKAKGIKLDVLVNNAGQGQWGEFYAIELPRLLDLIQLNIVALTSLTHLCLQDMVKRGEGKILNVASVASAMPHPLLAVYAATKAYVLSFSEALHNEMLEHDITVTALMPGPTESDFWEKADMEMTKAGQGPKDEAHEVAKTGFEALMAGKDKVVVGLKNKLQVAGSHVMPDEMVAANTRKQMELEDEEPKKDN